MKKGSALLLLLVAVGFGMGVEHVLLHMLQAKPLIPLSTTMVYLPNDEPGWVTVHVRDAQGRPVVGAEVWVTDTSASSQGKTAGDGIARIKINDDEIVGIEVNDRCILKSYWIRRVPGGMDVYYLEDSAPVTKPKNESPALR